MPNLDLDWEMGIFRGLRGLWRSVRREAPPNEHAARLEPYTARLTTLAGLLSGDALRIRPARRAGGLRGRDLLLPVEMDLGPSVEDNYSLYVLRVALGATLWRERHDHKRPADILEWLKLCDGIRRRSSATWPRLAEVHERARRWELESRPAAASLRGRARLEEEIRQAALRGEQPWDDAELRRAVRASHRRPRQPSQPIMVWGEPIMFDAEIPDTLESAEDTPQASPSTEMEAHAVEDLRVLVLDEKDTKELPTHVFEKVETLEEFDGGMTKMDAEDDLADHSEALEEVDLRDLVRGGEQAQSVYRADITMDIGIPDISRAAMEENGIPYDEWDYRKKAYRKDWTTVFEATVPPGGDPTWARQTQAKHRKSIEELFGRLLRHRDRLRPQNRQLDGEFFDLDALIDERAAALGGRGGNGRLYVRKDRRLRDSATTVLVDISLSTDSYVDNQRVIDVAKEAVLVLGTVSERLGDELRVLAFASHTRNQVRVWEVKAWGESWNKGMRRLTLLEPQGYTRIGPAIRHATKDLAATQAARRLLLLISDGKPSDFDKYEGRYGVADVRRAVQEAHKQGVHVHGLAVEAKARDYLPAMLGAGAWHLLPHAEHLPALLTTIYGRLTTQC